MTTIAIKAEHAAGLAEQIGAAAAGTRFELEAGTYELGPTVARQEELTLAAADPRATVLQVGGKFGIAVEGGSLTLEGLTVRGGHGRWGGGILVVNGARLNLDRCIVADNVADRIGGGIQLERGELLAARCVFARNTAEAGAALAAARGCTAMVDRCLFLDNEAQVGAGLMINADARVGITSCTFSGNRATLEGERGGSAVALLAEPGRRPRVALINCVLADAEPLANHPVKSGELRVMHTLVVPGGLRDLVHEDDGGNVEAAAELVPLEHELSALRPGSPGHLTADIELIPPDAADFLDRPLVIEGKADPGAVGRID